MARNIELLDKERFLKKHTIPREKLEAAAKKATDKLLERTKRIGSGFPGTCSVDYKYKLNDQTNWESGMYTGCFWLAYELTGNEEFKDIAMSHMKSYKYNIDEKENIHDHDVGFTYTPSVVAAYKLTGDREALDIAMDTVKFYYEKSYSKEGKFIIRAYRSWDDVWGCRTMMDSLMNAPFFFWAAEETGNKDYYEAALNQNLTSEKYLIRDDGSSFHHYQFDPKTAKPVKGVTLQGYSDESCWSRGHSWGVYGFPIAYTYTGNETIKEVHKDITYYMLNKLPDSLIPAWDFIFPADNIDVPRDSSCGAVCVCGMNEMIKHLDDSDEQKVIFENASSMMLEALIDNCTGDIGVEYDGLINQVTHALPQGQGINECAVYGDYFYLEALTRFLKPDWKMYW